MTIPGVMFIEMAMDMLRTRDSAMLAREAKEFRSLGPARLAEICTEAARASEDSADRMLAGYLMGLETARALLAAMPKAVQAGVTL